MSNSIFKPSNDYRELLILDAISANAKVTQRELARITDMSVAMINSLLLNYESDGLITKDVTNSKIVSYYVTKKGIEELKYLSVNYIKASFEIYNSAKNECIRYFEKLANNKYHKILLYGAGKVCEMLLHVLKDNKDLDINIVGIVDDDLSKVGEEVFGYEIISFKQISFKKYDCILITSFNHKEQMKDNISNYNISDNKIKVFFE